VSERVKKRERERERKREREESLRPFDSGFRIQLVLFWVLENLPFLETF
jgi:hypothetical protein